MFHFGGFTDSPHPHKQETRGLDTIQATSFFPWWILFEAQGDLYKILKSGENPEKSQAFSSRFLLSTDCRFPGLGNFGYKAHAWVY